MDTGVHLTTLASPALFTGPASAPEQVLRVTVRRTRAAGPLLVRVEGPGVTTPHAPVLREAGEPCPTEDRVEVSVRLTGAPAPGTRLPVTAYATAPDGLELARLEAEMTVAEPGWTLRLVPCVPHGPTGLLPHLRAARDDPEYRFALSGADCVEHFPDAHPEHREEVRRLIGEGRLEIVAGPCAASDGPSAESTVRGVRHGLALPEGVLGARTHTAWQPDGSGHDPSFPDLMARRGLDSAVLVRGPHHPWGPVTDVPGALARPPSAARLPAEYEWIGPGGDGLLLHHAAGWFPRSPSDPDAAAEEVLELYELLRPAAATRNVLLPTGTDSSWPYAWGTGVRRRLARRYTWPRVEHAVPAQHFAAVRAELAARGELPLPVTREPGPSQGGGDVPYTDMTRARWAAGTALLRAGTFAPLAHAATGARVPADALGNAWRQALRAAHHDGVTDASSDQAYLDLLPAWREAEEVADEVTAAALARLTARIDTGGEGLALTVFNPLPWPRTDVVRTEVALDGADPDALRLRDGDGAERLVHVEAVGGGRAALVFLAEDVPALGHRTWWLTGSGTPLLRGWQADPDPEGGPEIANGFLRARADPERGGGLVSVTDLRTGRELLTRGEAVELVLRDAYRALPSPGEGSGDAGTGTAACPAGSVHVEYGTLGSRLVATGVLAGTVRWRSTMTLWHGVDRLELTTDVEEFTGSDQLLRLRVPADVPGALPVAETAAAVMGRGFAFPDAGTGTGDEPVPGTLEGSCPNWFGLSSVLRAELAGPDGAPAGTRAVGAVEVVLPAAGLPGHGRPSADGAPALRDLVTALGRRGATAEPTRAAGPRWGAADADDGGPPDLRIALGGPRDNPFTEAVLASADGPYRDAVEAGPGPSPYALVWVPARVPLRAAWTPGCDLTGGRDLPVAVLTHPEGGEDAALRALAADLDAHGVLRVRHPAPADGTGERGPFEDRTVALLVRGTPGFAVDTRGRLHSSLLRSSAGRPDGEWTDPPRRTAPDGSSFRLQHWTHRFEHALVCGDGDWRAAELVRRGREFALPLSCAASPPGPGPLPHRWSPLPAAGPLPSEAGRCRTRTVGTAPLSVTVAPRRLVHDGGALTARVTVRAGTGPGAAPRSPSVRVDAPDGWTVDRPERQVDLAPDGFAAHDLRIEVPPGTAPGHYLVRVLASCAAEGTAEDRVTVAVAGPDGAPVEQALSVEALTGSVRLCPGGRGSVRLRVSNPLRSALRGQLLTLTPYGAYALAPVRATALEVPPLGTVETVLALRAPLTLPPGTYWVGAKAVLEGRVGYAQPVAVHVLR
ncbi:NEW3 domain-containing protein [Streptomyces sp. NPDC001941]|uniref:glycoside hydrolase family 38 N-terminal domain-containing protein n=1 Tax=Streptomyces sp. NPDC001941 TaxID=3154659 RepID=UPI003321AC0D